MLSAGAALLLTCAVSRADVEERIARCTEEPFSTARIACLEDSLRELADGPATPAPRATSDREPAAPPSPDDVPAAEVELGAEQVAAREGSEHEEENLRATVVNFRFVGYRRLLVQLDNGQVWQQIEGDRESVERGLRNEESFEVEMWATGLGGYRMHIVPLDRTIRVERLR